jgi:hypothetical protein
VTPGCVKGGVEARWPDLRRLGRRAGLLWFWGGYTMVILDVELVNRCQG